MITASLSVSELLYGHSQPLFAPLSFVCQPGNIWAVLGANGRGKSTLLDTLTGVLPALGGQFSIDGGVSVVPQSFHPVFAWQVQDVVLMGRARHVPLFSQPSAEDRHRVAKALEQLNISELAQQHVGTLSGGQEQLVMIARALVSGSQNILLDEPCSALDLANQQTVLQLIHDLAHRQQRSVLFTTHDPTHALQVASHTLMLMPDGKWLAGETDAVVTDRHLLQAYGVPVRTLTLEDYPRQVIAPLFSIEREKSGLT